MSFTDWKTNVEIARQAKDEFFSQHWQSPTLLEDRFRFKGLEYYSPDPSYRFELELREHTEKQAVRMAYTRGNEQDFLRWGEFRFKIVGKEQILQAYNPWCVYIEAYTCPFVLIENCLEVPILAGEKTIH